MEGGSKYHVVDCPHLWQPLSWGKSPFKSRERDGGGEEKQKIERNALFISDALPSSGAVASPAAWLNDTRGGGHGRPRGTRSISNLDSIHSSREKSVLAKN